MAQAERTAWICYGRKMYPIDPLEDGNYKDARCRNAIEGTCHSELFEQDDEDEGDEGGFKAKKMPRLVSCNECFLTLCYQCIPEDAHFVTKKRGVKWDDQN